VLQDGCEKLIQALADRFPQLNQKINQIRMESKNIETLLSLTVPEAISVIAQPTDLVVR
jgi:hypothetical protein